MKLGKTLLKKAEVSTMSEKKFNCMEFDDDNNRINILIGDKGFVDYKDITKVSILNQQASFKGEEKPFTHQILNGTAFLCGIMEPQFYVGLKIILKDETIKAVFISNRKTIFNTYIYNEDKKEAEEIKKMLDNRISK